MQSRWTGTVPPRYDVKSARFALNQGSRKICSVGVTCPGLIRCIGLEQSYFRPFYLLHRSFLEPFHIRFYFSVSGLVSNDGVCPEFIFNDGSINEKAGEIYSTLLE